MKIELNVNPGFVRSVFFFEAWLSPKLILIAYWIMLAGCVIGGLTMIFSGTYSFVSNAPMGWALLILGPIGARIICEGAMVIFKINDNLQQIRVLQEHTLQEQE